MLKHYLSAAGCSVLVIALCSSGQVAQAGFPELVRRVPSDANAIMLIDADRLFATPMARQENWKKKQVAEFAERPLAISPQAQRVVRAARVDLQAREPQWEIVMVEQPKAGSLDDIARREKGYVDRVANTKVAWSPRGAYVVSLGKEAFGLLFPPNRQFLAQWLKQPSGKISPYLLEASQSISATDAQILLALDLDDAIDPQRVRAMLNKSRAVAETKADAHALEEAISELRGVKFEIVVKDKPWGRLMLEFSHSPAALKNVAKPLVLEVLQQAGAALDDIADWTVSTSDKRISLHGELSRNGLLRFGSLLELPSIELEAEEEPATDKPMLYATQNHFKSVSKLLDDLVMQKRDAKTFGQLAMWIDQYAKRIDRLPLVNVDPDMQKYSAEVAEDLRQMSASMKGSGIRSGVQTASTYDAGYGWGNYDGYYGSREVDAQRRAIRAQERGASALTSQQIAEAIRAETSRIRRAMTERYKVEF